MEVFSRIVALFIVLVVGAITGKIGIVSSEFRRDLSQFLVKIALPMFLFNSMISGQGTQDIGSGLPMILLCFGIYGSAIILATILSKFWPVSELKKPSYTFAMVFPNMGFLGLPVLEAALGAQGVFYGAFYILFVDVILWTYGVYLFRGNSGGKIRLKQMITPSIAAILLALVFLILNIKLPEMVLLPIGLLGSLSPPLSMVILGLLLSEMELKEIVDGPAAIFTVLYRLVFFPLATYGVLSFLNFSSYYLYVPVIVMAMPVAAIGAVQASSYGKEYKSITGLIVLSTMLSLITIPMIIKIIM
ncbi:MAG: AEC family transporter [Tissierellia bacterium]|nr:AEC family transporter [Tissierellia bacterium]